MNNDLGKTIVCLKTARSGVEAWGVIYTTVTKNQIKPEQASVAGGCSDDDLRAKTQQLAKAISDYKQGSKSANSLYSQHKPKSNPKAKAKAKASASPDAAQ